VSAKAIAAEAKRMDVVEASAHLALVRRLRDDLRL